MPKPTTADYHAIGERITSLRMAHGITQVELAKRCYVTQPAVSQWEKGRTMPNASTQFLVADALRVNRSVLFRELLEAVA